MAFVLDCSVTLAWLLPDEDGAAVDALAEELARTTAVVPAIWPYEVVNALQVAQRRARIGDDDLIRVWSALAALPIDIEAVAKDHAFSAVAHLGRRLGITCYDAAYVELAERRKLPLATLDARLRKACASLKIAVLP
jgi:predicted nucleic acid-binding protein